ncbi:MAG: MEDS domain-containing protein [Pyrinomonadaceae bacterium]|nr:MEDS domain-containing protein [Pyrinomonadaceae bacterium]
MHNRAIELGIRDEQVSAGDHIAYLWQSDEEFAEGVRFLEAGLRGEDHCVIFGYEEANEKVCNLLSGRGFDVGALVSAGRLTLLGGEVDGDSMLANIGASFTGALERGAKLIRLLGNIGWGRPNWPLEKDILAFEARVTGAAKLFPSIIVCMYDVGSLSGNVVVHGAYETHPLTFRRNVLRQNTHYVEFKEFMDSLAQ